MIWHHPGFCLCTPTHHSVLDCVCLGQMFTSRDDTQSEPGNSCEGSPGLAFPLVLQCLRLWGEGRSPVGLWVGGWCAWCVASPSALFHVPLMSQRAQVRGQPSRGDRVKLHLMNMDEHQARGTIWSALLETKQMSVLRRWRISVITVDFPGLKNSGTTCWVPLCSQQQQLVLD